MRTAPLLELGKAKIGMRVSPSPLAPIEMLDVAGIGFLYPQVSNADSHDLKEQFSSVTNNTGNVLFVESLAEFFRWGVRLTQMEVLPPDITTLVLSLGNWISPAVDLGYMARAIEASNVERIVMVGAGVQAQTKEEPIVLQPGTRRLLDLAAERSVSIGVRGDFTAEFLASLGIANVDVIGCPSVFMVDANPRPAPHGRPLRLVVHTTWHGHYRDAITELLSFGRRHDALLIEQSNENLVSHAVHGEMNSHIQHMIRYYSRDHVESWELLKWLRLNVRTYFNTDAWRASLCNADLVIGSRFHGNIVAAMAGARTLTLTLDTRTDELTQYFNLPHMRFVDFDASLSPEQYFEQADPDLFMRTLPSRKARMQAFLLRNGLTLSPSFTAPPTVSATEILRDGPADGEAAARRLRADAAALGLPASTVTAEQARRIQPLRTAAEGDAIDRAEFVVTRSDRTNGHPPRLSWRARQGVRTEYRHQSEPIAYDDHGQRDGWQRHVYLNAERIARANDFVRIVDFGCGSGFKLLDILGGYDTIGIEIEPMLSDLVARHPERKWHDGRFISPDLFGKELVICADVLEHLIEPDRLLSAMAASCAAVFVISTPALEIMAERGQSPRLGPPANPSHVYEWTTGEFRALVGTHLRVLAHAIVNLQQATQLCVACRRNDPRTYVLPELLCDGGAFDDV